MDEVVAFTLKNRLDEANYNKAIGYWNEFLRRWPLDPKVVEVKIAIAQTSGRRQ